MRKELARAPKRQHLTTLQRALNDTPRRLSARAPIVATPGLIKLTLDLGFRIDHRYNIGTGLHQFGLNQHTYASQKVLNTHDD